jgi:hypothetical protein
LNCDPRFKAAVRGLRLRKSPVSAQCHSQGGHGSLVVARQSLSVIATVISEASFCWAAVECCGLGIKRPAEFSISSSLVKMNPPLRNPYAYLVPARGTGTASPPRPSAIPKLTTVRCLPTAFPAIAASALSGVATDRKVYRYGNCRRSCFASCVLRIPDSPERAVVSPSAPAPSPQPATVATKTAATSSRQMRRFVLNIEQSIGSITRVVLLAWRNPGDTSP